MMSTVIYDRTVIYETLCNDQKVNIIFIIRCEIRPNFRTEIFSFFIGKIIQKIYSLIHWICDSDRFDARTTGERKFVEENFEREK